VNGVGYHADIVDIVEGVAGLDRELLAGIDGHHPSRSKGTASARRTE
jgi:hypothetical protein